MEVRRGRVGWRLLLELLGAERDPGAKSDYYLTYLVDCAVNSLYRL